MASSRMVLLVMGRFGMAGSAPAQPKWGDVGHCAKIFDLAAQQPDLVLDRPQAWLDAHNHYRACHGVPPLEWDENMVPYARAWAENLLQHCDGTQDLTTWAGAEGPGETRPHDPNSYNEVPSMGENIYSQTGFQTGTPEAAIVEGWYREIESECPNRGQRPGCGASLNHFTALIWKDATHLGCASVARQTPLGPFVVVDCRYSSAKPLSMHHCSTPNTMNCDGPQHPEDGSQVPALTSGSCSKAEPVPSSPPPGNAGPKVTQDCIAQGSLGKCEPCIVSDQCGDDRFCCPFMKKCVKDGHETCYSPIANCLPPCLEGENGHENGDPKECGCKTPEFPCLWQKPLCGKPTTCTNEEMIQPDKAPWDQDLGLGDHSTLSQRVSSRADRLGEMLGPASEDFRQNAAPVEKRLDQLLGIERKSGATPWALLAAIMFGSCVFCTVLRTICCGCGGSDQAMYQQPYGGYQSYPPNNQQYQHY